jgi:hypothetical protein
MENEVEIRSVKFVSVSDIFDGTGELWDEYCNHESNHSWGDNEHSLVKPSSIQSVLESIDGFDEDNPSQSPLTFKVD